MSTFFLISIRHLQKTGCRLHYRRLNDSTTDSWRPVDEIDGQALETCLILAAAAINHCIEVLKLTVLFSMNQRALDLRTRERRDRGFPRLILSGFRRRLGKCGGTRNA